MMTVATVAGLAASWAFWWPGPPLLAASSLAILPATLYGNMVVMSPVEAAGGMESDIIFWLAIVGYGPPLADRFAGRPAGSLDAVVAFGASATKAG